MQDFDKRTLIASGKATDGHAMHGCQIGRRSNGQLLIITKGAKGSIPWTGDLVGDFTSVRNFMALVSVPRSHRICVGSKTTWPS